MKDKPGYAHLVAEIDKIKRELAAAQAALKLALNALEVWRFMHPDTTACAVRIPAIAAIKKVFKECGK